jgi:hypothetical protein
VNLKEKEETAVIELTPQAYEVREKDTSSKLRMCD